MTKIEFITFDEKLAASWGLEKTANESLRQRIDKLTAENERLRLELDMAQATILVPSQKDDRRTIERLREELVSALNDAARLREAIGKLKAVLRVNMLRAFPETSHKVIDAEIAKALGETE